MFKIFPFKSLKPRYGEATERQFNSYYYYKKKQKINKMKNKYGKNLNKFLVKY